MAYKEIIGKSVADCGACLTEMYTQLESIGWTKVDSQAYEGSCNPADVSTANDTITIVGHSFVNGQHIQYYNGGTPIGGLSVYNLYFIVGVSGNTFKLSTSQGGAAIDLTSQGVGTHYFREGYRVYSTNGESGSKPTQYIQIIRGTNSMQGYLLLKPFYYWNASTHAGSGGCSSVYGYMTVNVGSTFYLWVYGDKDWVTFVAKTGTNYTGMVAGYFNRYWDIETTLTQAETSGTPKQIHVASTADFIAGKKYQIFSLSNEGRDTVLVNSIDSSTTMTLASLPRNYASGSIIGQTPCTFMAGSWTTSSMQTIFHNAATAVGLGDTSIYGAPIVMINATYVDPDDRGDQKYLLQPYLLAETSAFAGWTPDHFLFCPSTGMTIEDTIGVTENDSGTATAGAASTITDSGKSWASEAWAGKAVIIKTGTGAGQIRKITTNSGTVLTVSPNWTTIPDTSSTYVIVNEAYRYLGGGGNPVALREGHA